MQLCGVSTGSCSRPTTPRHQCFVSRFEPDGLTRFDFGVALVTALRRADLVVAHLVASTHLKEAAVPGRLIRSFPGTGDKAGGQSEALLLLHLLFLLTRSGSLFLPPPPPPPPPPSPLSPSLPLSSLPSPLSLECILGLKVRSNQAVDLLAENVNSRTPTSTSRRRGAARTWRPSRAPTARGPDRLWLRSRRRTRGRAS